MGEAGSVTREATNRREMDSWRDKRVLVMGMARSGRAAARLLARHGARVRGTDLRTADALALDTTVLERDGVTLRLGDHDFRDLDGADLVVVSPGIPKTAPFLEEARRRGVPVLSELEVAARFATAPIAAVTGTNGKSTTVTVLGALVAALGRPVEVAGNVGRALSEVVETVSAEGVLVVEVSSFQLEDVRRFHPRAAALLNATPDHLDRYSSFEDYVRTKLRIFSRQGPEDTAVLPTRDPVLERMQAQEGLRARLLRFGIGGETGDGVTVRDGQLTWIAGGQEKAILPVEELSLPGPHNQANAAAALCLLAGLGLDPFHPAVAETLRTVRGLPHRLERVGEVEGVVFYDDSKATNPESLEVALNAFPQGVVLIAGGRAKGGDYARLAGLVGRRAATVVLIGEAAEMLREAWEPAGVPLVPAGTDFEAAVRLAFRAARERGLPVLLSPGCASFDMFRDYEQRGEVFRNLVREWGKGR